MKRENGITLIALIITIIVMLILVAVTVAIAVNGGIFINSRNSAKETEKHSLFETIVSAMKLSNDGDILIKETAQGAKATIEEDKTNDGEIDRPTTIEYDDDTNPTYAILTVEGNTGTYKYKITSSEILFYEEENGENSNENNSTEGGNVEIASDWYKFTPKEFQDLRDIQEEQGGDIFMEIDITTQEEAEEYGFPINTKIIMGTPLDVEGVYICALNDDYVVKIRDCYYITGNSPIDFYSWIIFDESFPRQQWFTYNGEDEFELYTGSCPLILNEGILDFYDADVYCETYLDRARATFGSNWYDMTNEEAVEIFTAQEGNVYSDYLYSHLIIAESENTEAWYLIDDGYIILEDERTSPEYAYIYFITDKEIKDSFDYQDGLQTGIWYVGSAADLWGDPGWDLERDEIPLTEYTGNTAPLQTDHFEDIYCRDYLIKILASFGNNN